MENPIEWINSLIKLRRDVQDIRRDQADSFRKEAQRIIDAFNAHDIPPNEVMRILPEGMLDDPSEFENAQSLKKHLAKVSPWAQATLCLDPAWLKGRSNVPHKRVCSYKDLLTLVEFLQQKEHESADMNRFSIHVFKQDALPFDRSEGPMVIVLEETFEEVDDVPYQRFYYLSEGLEFGPLHCMLNLMHVVAFAHHYGIKVWGRTMKPACLIRLDQGVGFIPDLWRGELYKPWHPEDILWRGLTGDPAWKERMQADLDAGLRREGFTWLADKIEADRARFSAGRQGVVTS